VTAHQFLESLSARGIALVVEPRAPSGIKLVAPPGVITPEVAGRIKRALPALRPLLQKEARWQEIRRLGAEVEALLTAEMEAQETMTTIRGLTRLPRHVLDAPGPWRISPGVTASSPARWLARNLERADALTARCGPHWWRDNAAGVELLTEFKALVVWLQEAGVL
jgi:hypothetical protein